MKPRIIIDEHIPYIKGLLEEVASVVYMPGRQITAADVKEADALIIRTRTKCDASLLDGSRVRFIATATIGYDHIDVSYCARNGIVWTN
ncbi:MAG: 4-phosphoerythronate dehydrogenase, partial [Bacteroidales bacterium]|nr:4-phosphoerythronate dehydrogenase [Bacteroidales bacterium]